MAGGRKPRDVEGSPRRRLVRRPLPTVAARRKPALGGRSAGDPYASRRLGRIEGGGYATRGRSRTLAQATALLPERAEATTCTARSSSPRVKPRLSKRGWLSSEASVSR